MAKFGGIKLGLIVIIILIIGIAIYSGTYYFADDYQIQKGDIKITRVIVRDAQKESRLGEKSDWVEIQNTTNRELHLEKGQWFITDKAIKKPARFPLPELFIKPQEKVRIWCSGEDMHGKEIHTNFKLDPDGERVAIFIINDEDEVMTLDRFFYSDAGDNRGFELRENAAKPID